MKYCQHPDQLNQHLVTINGQMKLQGKTVSIEEQKKYREKLLFELGRGNLGSDCDLFFH